MFLLVVDRQKALQTVGSYEPAVKLESMKIWLLLRVFTLTAPANAVGPEKLAMAAGAVFLV